MNEKIFAILNELRPEFDFTASENFVEDGLLDSFDLVSLSEQLEEVFNMKIDGLDLTPDNFMTVDAIAALVKKSGGKE